MTHSDTGETGFITMARGSRGELEDRIEGASRVLNDLMASLHGAKENRSLIGFCPQCGQEFRRSRRSQVFCSNGRRSRRNCKDRFWNRVRGLREAVADATEALSNKNRWGPS